MNVTIAANLSRVVQRLQEIGISNVVFVGGATIGLFLTDPAAPEPRATLDIDVVAPVASRRAYNQLEEKLREAGFTQPTEEGDPVCRWIIDGVTVDLMPPDESVLGFSNRWYLDLISHAQAMTLPDGTTLRLVTTPYLIASKIEAFHGRGKTDYRFSHDLEDIIILLDGREEIFEEVQQAPKDVRGFIVSEFRDLLVNEDFVEAISEHLPPDLASQARAPIIITRMRRIIEVGRKSLD